jgi:hypothetical protein
MIKKAIAVIVLGLIIVIYAIVPAFIQVDEKDARLSAWRGSFEDLDYMRDQIETMHKMTREDEFGVPQPVFDMDDEYSVRSIVTGPTILSIDSVDPEKSLYIVNGLEKPLSQEGIDGLTEYLKQGGHAIIADNSDNVRSLASNFGVTYYPGKFFDESYDINSSYTQINARLGVDRMTPKYIPHDTAENMVMNQEDNPWPDGIWDDDTDGDGKVDEDPVESQFVAAADDDKDLGKIQNDNRDNDNDWIPDDGGFDPTGAKIEIVGNEEGINEDVADDDGDGREDEEMINGLDDDNDGLVDEDINGYRLILSDPSGMSSIGSRIIAHGSVNSYVDMNGDGKITTPKPGDPTDQLIDAISSPGSEIQLIVEVVVSPDNGMPLDLAGFSEVINGDEKVRKVSTLELSGLDDTEKATHDMADIHEFGTITFIADSSIFINDLVTLDHITYAPPFDGKDNDGDGLYDEPYEIETDEFNSEPQDENGILDNTPDGESDYDNEAFLKELVYYYLPDGGVVIFDESRHVQPESYMIPIYSTINTAIFLTSDPIYAVSLVIITVIILILAVIITRNKENWVHRFDTSKFKGRSSMPESRRDKARILRKSVLEKVRLGRSLSPEEFSQLSPKVVDSFIRDQQLVELVRNEGREYTEAELGALAEKIMAYR